MNGAALRQITEMTVNNTRIGQLKWTFTNGIQAYLLDSIDDQLEGEVYFVQVGANDGQMADPVSKYIKCSKWRGLLFEPVASHFAKLEEFYQGTERAVLINGACGPKSETLKFFEIDQASAVPEPWMRGLSSFDRHTIRKHFKSEEEFEKYVVEKTIPVRSLDDYFTEYNQTRCDVLLIDTEGFELSVLSGFDIDKYHPAVIMMEHQHLGRELFDKCVEDMRAKGYIPAIAYFDTLFFDPHVFGEYSVRLLEPFQSRTYSNW
jgi:FkbM family methyltransferase